MGWREAGGAEWARGPLQNAEIVQHSVCQSGGVGREGLAHEYFEKVPRVIPLYPIQVHIVWRWKGKLAYVSFPLLDGEGVWLYKNTWAPPPAMISYMLGGPRYPLSSLSLSLFKWSTGCSHLRFPLSHLEWSISYRTAASGISFQCQVSLAHICRGSQSVLGCIFWQFLKWWYCVLLIRGVTCIEDAQAKQDIQLRRFRGPFYIFFSRWRVPHFHRKVGQVYGQG